MQLSNRLTFSLASLVLIFALVFAAMPVMAVDGGPKATIQKASGDQARNAFKVEVVWDTAVTNFEVDDIVVAGAPSKDDAGTDYNQGISNFTAATGADAGKKWTFTIEINHNSNDQYYEHSVIAVTIGEDRVNANVIGNSKGNQLSSAIIDDLPKGSEWTINAALKGNTLAATELDDGKLKHGATFDVEFTWTNGPVGTAYPTSLTDNVIQINGNRGATDPGIESISVVGPTAGKATVTVTVISGSGTINPVMIGISPNYAAGNKITVPTPTTSPTMPTVTLSLHGDIDAVGEMFRVRLEFSKAIDDLDASKVKIFQANADGTKSTTAALVAAPTLTKLGGGMSWIAEIDYEFDELPLYVTVADIVSAMTPADGLKVGGTTTTPPPANAPGAPTEVIATAGQTANTVDVSWTAPTDNGGSTITGYTIKQTGAAVATYTATASPFTTPALAEGDYSFTVAATNTNGTGAASAAATITVGADTTKPVVTFKPDNYKVAQDIGLNCEVGNTVTVTISEALGTGEALTPAEIKVSAGWGIELATTVDADDHVTSFGLVPNDDGTEIGVTQVTVSIAADVVKDASGNGNIAVSETYTVGPILTIPAGGYIVVIRPEHNMQANLSERSHLFGGRLYLGSTGVTGLPITIKEWDCMPDLTVVLGISELFGVAGGGAITVKLSPEDPDFGTTAAQKTAGLNKWRGQVGINEIMWASDLGAIYGTASNVRHTKEQWIELHNRNNEDVKVTLFARPASHALTTEVDELDRMSNVNFYNANDEWGVKGQSGNSVLGEHFISMARKIKDVEGLRYTDERRRGEYKDNWFASGDAYMRFGTTATAPTNQVYDFRGTPGRKNEFAATTAPDISLAVVFNEIANRQDLFHRYEWIELKNMTTADINLSNYSISIVTAIGSEKTLYTFPNNDGAYTIGKNGGLLLLVDTDPEDDGEHPLAVGHDIKGGNDQAVGLGKHPAKYAVTDFAGSGLPDDGKFVLILRHPDQPDGHKKPKTATNKQGTNKNLVDIAGWNPSLASLAGHNTQLWPLTYYQHSANLGNNKLESEKVHRRQHNKINGTDTNNRANPNHPDHAALRDVGYSGIGYRRAAQNTGAHGGTPGYEDIRKGKIVDLKDGTVRISEIMFDQGTGRTGLPQWIEIHNTSATEAINLKADDGWRLRIENLDDREMRVGQISGELNFKSSEVQTLLPKQTVLIASTRARSAGSATVNAAAVFIPTRVFSVWADARGAFDMKASSDPILSETGFHIELVDGKNNVVDRVGNLPVDKNGALMPGRGRSVGEVAWEWSAVKGVDTEADARSSVVRQSRKTAEAEFEAGVIPGGWISADASNYRRYIDTWYGDEDDIGSPGITIGGVLPVSLSKFRPERLDDGSIVIRWITESETNNAGFNILRSETRDGEFTKLNTQLIAGQGTTSERTTYAFPDTSAKPNVIYYYQIQDVSLDGQINTLRPTRLKGHVSAAGKLTTTWGELKALQ